MLSVLSHIEGAVFLNDSGKFKEIRRFTMARVVQLEQIEKIIGLFEGVMHGPLFNLNDEGMANLLKNWSLFRQYLIAGVEKFSASGELVRGQNVHSEPAYPDAYKGPKPIEEQIKILADRFGLNSEDALSFAANLPTLPKGAEGWFAFLSFRALAENHFPEVTNLEEMYITALKFVFAKIAESRECYIYNDGKILPEQLRLNAHTADSMEAIAQTQNGGIIVLPAQFGGRYKKLSVNEVRKALSDQKKEFGLDALSLACMFLTHPERAVESDKQLHVNCLGEEFATNTYDDFSHVMHFCLHHGTFMLHIVDLERIDECSGSASGFLVP